MKQRGPKSAASKATAPAFEVVPGLPFQPPPTLTPAGREIFREVMGSVVLDHFEDSDLPLLEQFAEATALARRAALELEKGDPPAVRWLSIWRDATRTMALLAMRLRLSPQARREKAKAPRTLTFSETLRMNPDAYRSAGPIPGFEGVDWKPPKDQ